MFSNTTIAASTTMPTAKAMPAREITLIDRPMAAMATKAATTEIGIAIDTISVARNERRNTSRMIAASEPNTTWFDLESPVDVRKLSAPMRALEGLHGLVIIDEIQNMSRGECRALLSRMGEDVKCFCLGDTRQVDHPYLNAENNGLNWIVNKFKGNRAYAHLVLKGDKSRGPITDLVIKSGL